jgi:hypothetical protein
MPDAVDTVQMLIEAEALRARRPVPRLALERVAQRPLDVGDVRGFYSSRDPFERVGLAPSNASARVSPSLAVAGSGVLDGMAGWAKPQERVRLQLPAISGALEERLYRYRLMRERKIPTVEAAMEEGVPDSDSESHDDDDNDGSHVERKQWHSTGWRRLSAMDSVAPPPSNAEWQTRDYRSRQRKLSVDSAGTSVEEGESRPLKHMLDKRERRGSLTIGDIDDDLAEAQAASMSESLRASALLATVPRRAYLVACEQIFARPIRLAALAMVIQPRPQPLTLSGSFIDHRGALALAAGLRCRPSISSLDISDCGLLPLPAATLFTAISEGYMHAPKSSTVDFRGKKKLGVDESLLETLLVPELVREASTKSSPASQSEAPDERPREMPPHRHRHVRAAPSSDLLTADAVGQVFRSQLRQIANRSVPRHQDQPSLFQPSQPPMALAPHSTMILPAMSTLSLPVPTTDPHDVYITGLVGRPEATLTATIPLTDLDVSGNILFKPGETIGLSALIDLIVQGRTLNRLYARRCAIPSLFLEWLTAIMVPPADKPRADASLACRLRALDLANNAIDSTGAIALARGIDSVKWVFPLEMLDLSDNPIGVRGDGVRNLFESLSTQAGRNLYKLRMSGCSLYDHQLADSLAAFLENATSLQELDLSHNHLGSGVGKVLTSYLKGNDSLQALRIGFNPLSFKTTVLLIATMAHSKLQFLAIENTLAEVVPSVMQVQADLASRIGEPASALSAPTKVVPGKDVEKKRPARPATKSKTKKQSTGRKIVPSTSAPPLAGVEKKEEDATLSLTGDDQVQLLHELAMLVVQHRARIDPESELAHISVEWPRIQGRQPRLGVFRVYGHHLREHEAFGPLVEGSKDDKGLKLLEKVCPEAASFVTTAQSENVSDEADATWNLDDSVFKARKVYAPSRAFFDTPALVARAFESDWARTRLSSFLREESIVLAIKEVVAAKYAGLIEVFRFYCSFDTNPFEMRFPVFQEWRRRCLIVSPDPGIDASLDSCFQGADFDAGGPSAGGGGDSKSFNPMGALVRHEFLEVVVRLAVVMDGGRPTVPAVATSAIQTLLDHRVFPTAKNDFGMFSSMDLHSNTFRRLRLYVPAMDRVVRELWGFLSDIYEQYSGEAGSGKRTGMTQYMTIRLWKKMLKDAFMLNSSQGFSVREAQYIFIVSNCIAEDDLSKVGSRSRSHDQTLTKGEFVEAVCRLADSPSAVYFFGIPQSRLRTAALATLVAVRRGLGGPPAAPPRPQGVRSRAPLPPKRGPSVPRSIVAEMDSARKLVSLTDYRARQLATLSLPTRVVLLVKHIHSITIQGSIGQQMHALSSAAVATTTAAPAPTTASAAAAGSIVPDSPRRHSTSEDASPLMGASPAAVLAEAMLHRQAAAQLRRDRYRESVKSDAGTDDSHSSAESGHAFRRLPVPHDPLMSAHAAKVRTLKDGVIPSAI